MFEENISPKVPQLLHSGEKYMKIKILVCDDDLLFIENFSDQLKKCSVKNYQLAIHTETDPSKLSDQQLISFDIAFLDIDMAPLNGIALAKRMRELQSKAILIFVTNYIEYSPEGYEVQAFRFLMKSQLKEKLPIYFKAAIDELEQKCQTLNFSLNGEPIAIETSNIIYLESNGRKINLHNIQSSYSNICFYGTIDHLTDQLKSSGFLRIHKSYLVNINYINNLHYNQVILTDGTVLPVSERRYSALRKQYLNWKLYQN